MNIRQMLDSQRQICGTLFGKPVLEDDHAIIQRLIKENTERASEVESLKRQMELDSSKKRFLYEYHNFYRFLHRIVFSLTNCYLFSNQNRSI